MKNRDQGNRGAGIKPPRELDLPPSDYRPIKAEMLKEHDMPGADWDTLRSAFFRPVKARKRASNQTRP